MIKLLGRSEEIMRLHKECMSKHATPANELVLKAKIEKLESNYCSALLEIMELCEMLEATTAYVELYTGNGVQKQPPEKYIKPNGGFDAEAIALNARMVLRKVG